MLLMLSRVTHATTGSNLLITQTLRLKKLKVQKRLEQAIMPCHLTAYLMHPTYRGELLSSQQIEMTKEWLASKDDQYLALVTAFQVQVEPFPSFFFKSTAVPMKPTIWWKSLSCSADIPANFIECMIQLHSACASSSSIERIFSNFGLVYSKQKSSWFGKSKEACACVQTFTRTWWDWLLMNYWHEISNSYFTCALIYFIILAISEFNFFLNYFISLA